MKKKKIVIISAVSLVAVILLAITYGKYIAEGAWNYYLKSNGFYFTSDNLGEETVSNVNNIWDGNSVNFNIKNYLNQELATGYDINYDVVCTIEGDAATYAACYLDGTESSEASGTLSASQYCSNVTGDSVDVSSYDQAACEGGGYIWKNDITSADSYFDIVLTNESYEITNLVVDITVTSTSPYTKALSGTFTLNKVSVDTGSLLMDYNSYSDYERLTITNTYSSDKCVSISWSSDDLLIDSNDYLVYNSDSNGFINNIEFLLTSKNSTSYVFYKRNSSSSFGVEDFTIEEGTGC